MAPAAAVSESATTASAPVATSSRERIAGENQSNFLPLDADGRTTYTVILKEPAVASYEGGLSGLAAVPKQRTGKHVGRPDINSSEAQAYTLHLEQVQGDFVADVAASLGRPLTASAQFQHALNAVILSLTPAEADALRQRDDVQLVARERKRKLDTFASPTFIGAANLWNDNSAPNGIGYKGEGIVVGVIDSGVNYLSNSFKSPGDDGYAPVNPLGDGTYLGLCVTGATNAGHCNSKLIGMYNTESTQSSRNGRDLDGHGSHTASTAAGGVVTNASFAGGTFSVSGIAPHANVITYLACGTVCSDTVLIAAINQAVANNIVDVINYSIGGPNDGPWLDAIDQAYLNAMNAGIFVATAAGNDGPGEVTTDSYAPWYTSAAASTPDQLPGFSLTVQGWSGTATMIPGSSPYPGQPYTDLPLIESPTFADGSNDGCAAFPANYFRRPQTAGGAQGIAVLHLDQNASNCASGARRTAAANAGAIAVVYVDPEFISLGATGASYSLEMGNWNAIKTAIGDVSGTTGSAVASISFPISGGPRPGDVLTGFSSRGPTSFGTLKPDVSAPGDTILAAISPTAANGYTGNPPATRVLYGTISGTSMASPHVAGSAALVRQVHEDWTPMEVKSALMSTAKTSMTLSNGDSANPNQRGAGRIDPSLAARAGLVFNETMANFQAANPASSGHPETLNLASYYHTGCVGSCAFPRTARTTGTPATWAISVSGLPAGSYSLSAPSFTLGSSGTFTYTLTVDSSQLTNGQWYYGDVTLTPDTKASDTIFKNGFDGLGASAGIVPQHLPIAIRGGTPRLAADQTAINATVTAGQSTTQDLVISNQGNPTLNWSITPTGGMLKGTIVSRKSSDFGLQDRTVVTAGTSTAIESTNTANAYGADWFQIYGSGTTLADLEMEGFTSTGDPISAIATQFAWRVWSDNANAPNGRPGNTVAGDQPPFWQYPSAAGGLPPTGAGMSYTTNGIRLSLADAGTSSPPLNAGRYWLNVAPSISGTGTVFYTLLAQVPGKTPSAKYSLPNNAQAANKAWRDTTLAALGGAGYNGYGMTVAVNAACGANWLSYSSTSGSLGAGGTSPVTVTVDASALSSGTYTAYLCISGNGTSPPYLGEGGDSLLLPVTLTVQAAPTFTVTPSVSGGNGTIDPATAQTVNQGATATFTLTPDSGYHVGTVGGTCPAGTLTGNSYTTGAIAADCTVEASFTADNATHTVTPSVGTPAGTISPDTAQTVNDGDTTTFTLTPDSGYQIDNVGGTCGGTLTGNSFTTAAVTNDCTVIANFVVIPPPFPLPYCTRGYSNNVEPITLVSVDGINNVTSATLNGTPADENFTAIVGQMAPNGGYPIMLQGNSDGNFTNAYAVYVDWDQNGTFGAGEGYYIGTIVNSTGVDGKFVSGTIAVPPGATLGQTRMRVVKQYTSSATPTLADAAACGTAGYGQAEDYTINVDPSAPIPPSLAKNFSPNNGAAGATTTLTLSLGSTNVAPITLTADLVDALPSGMVIATPAAASTTCGGTLTAADGGNTITLATGATIPNGGCSITVDTTAANGGIYVNTTSSLQTTAGNAPAATATYQAMQAGVLAYSTGFESPFTTGTINGQQGWSARTSDVSTATPANGLQHLVQTALASPTTTNQPLAISPTIAAGTAPFATMSANLRISRTTNGATWRFNPQDPAAGLVTTIVQFDRAAARNIQAAVWTGGTATFANTGAQWPVDTYFNFKLIVERATGAIRMCVDGAQIYENLAGNGTTGGNNISNLAVSQATGSGQTANNTLLVDDFAIDYTSTGTCSPPVATHTVTPSVGTPSGTISPNTAQTVNEGDTTAFTLTPDSGFHIDTVGGTCGGGLAGNVYTTDAVVGDCTVVANFAADAVPPTLQASFYSATHVASGAASTLTLTLGNDNATPATLTADLIDNLPSNVVVAATPNESTTCTGGTVTATAAATSFSLGTGAQIPANGSCTVKVDVSSTTAGAYTNTLAAGALQTDAGSNASSASDNLVVAGTFPAPYPSDSFTSGVEPISRVIFAGIDNASVTTTSTSSANYMQNFTVSVSPGQVAPRGGYTISVRGNTDGSFTNFINVYFDWNHDGTFNEDASEMTLIGSITNSNGNATTSTPVTGLVIVPPAARPGLTRMRVVKAYGAYGTSSGDQGYGQAEDYLVNVDPSLTPPPTPALVSQAFTPNYVSEGAGGITTFQVTLTNYNVGDLALTSNFTNTFPTGLIIAPTPNANTTCTGATLTANAGEGSVTLGSGSVIPGDIGCTVSVDVTTATGGIYTNVIAAGAVQTANGGSPIAADAVVQFYSPIPTYGTGFEPPFTLANVYNQQGWYSANVTSSQTANSNDWKVANTHSATDAQHLRATWTTAGQTTNYSFVLSPESGAGTSPYSTISANLAIQTLSTGATYDFAPQDSTTGSVITRVRFLRSGTNGATTGKIQVLDPYASSSDGYTDTGAMWTGATGGAATYFALKVVVDRSAGTFAVCVNGTRIWAGDGFSSNITDLAILANKGTGTINNFLDVDDIVIDNPLTDGGCTPEPSTVHPSSTHAQGTSAIDHASLRQSVLRAKAN